MKARAPAVAPPVGLALLLALLLPAAAVVLVALNAPLGMPELLPASYLLLALAALVSVGRAQPRRVTPAAIFFLLYLCWESAAFARAPEGAAALEKIAWIAAAAALAFLPGDHETRSILRRALPAWLAAAAAAIALYGLFHHFTHTGAAARALVEQENLEPEMRRRMLHALGQHRLSILFGNSNQLAAFFVLALPFVIVQAKRAVAWRRLAWSLAIGLILAALLCTKSRGGLLAAAATAVLLAWRGDVIGVPPFSTLKGARSGDNLPSRRFRLIFTVMVMLGLVLLVAFGAQRLRDTETIRARGEFWSVAAQMIRARPLAGYGTEAYASYYPAYRVPGGVEARQPHDWALEAAVEGGVLPALWVVALMVWLAALALRPGDDAVMGAGRVAAAVLAMQCLWDFHNSVPWLLLWLAAVFALAEAPRTLPGWAAGLLAALTVAAAAGFYLGASVWLTAPRAGLFTLALAVSALGFLVPHRAGRVAVAAGLLVLGWSVIHQGALAATDEESGLAAWREGDGTTARILFSRASQRQPWRPGPWAAQGVLLHQLHEDPSAARMLSTAIRYSPRTAHQHASLAEVYLAMQRPRDACAEANAAARLHPARAQYRRLLARALSALGQGDEAARQEEWGGRLEVLPDGGWLAPDLPRGAALRATLPPAQATP